MNNQVSLAIMAKILLLYEADAPDSSFVSFNYPAIPFTPQDLTFDGHDETVSPLEAKQAWADFSILTNLTLPVSQIREPSDRLLWDEYAKVLRPALVEVADRQLTDAEQQELAAAKTLLYRTETVTDVLGEEREATVPTEALVAYQTQRDRYVDAELQLNAERLTGEFAEDPELQAAWEAKRPALEAAVAAAQQDWVTQGHKHAVEDALADIERLEGGQPQVTWNDARFEFNSTEFKQTNPVTNGVFYPTTFLPKDFHQKGDRGWTRLELSGSEVDALCEEALETMPELAEALLGNGEDTQADVEISRLSVDLARVQLYRPWLREDLLTSPFWRWRLKQAPLSDGGNPPTGSCPAYTTALIFARNLDVELQPSSEKNAAAIARLQSGDLVTLGPMMIEPVAASAKPKSVHTLKSASLNSQLTKVVRQSEISAATGQAVNTAETVNKPKSVQSLAKARSRAVIPTRTTAQPRTKTVAAAAFRPTSVKQVSVPTSPSSRSRAVQRARPVKTSVGGGAKSRPQSDAARRANAARKARVVRASSRPVVRDHRSSGTATRVVVRDRRTGKVTPKPVQSARPVVRDHRRSQAPAPRQNRPGYRWDTHKQAWVRESSRPRPVTQGGYRGHVQAVLPDGSLGRKLGGVSITFEQLTSANAGRDVLYGGVSDRRLRPQVGTPSQPLTQVFNAQTDAAGFYQIKLPPGRYRVTASKFGYQDFNSDPEVFELKSSAYQSGDLYLERDSREDDLEDSFAGLQMIACICKMLPKSPNPAAGITFDG